MIMKMKLLECSNELDSKGKGVQGDGDTIVYPAAVTDPSACCVTCSVRLLFCLFVCFFQ